MVFGFLSRLVDSNDREIGRLSPILTAVNARAVLYWLVLGALTFGILMLGYGSGFWR